VAPPLARGLAALLLLALTPPAGADRLVTHDGRVLELVKARALPGGDYQLVFDSGEIVCPARYVASVEIEGNMADYVPQNEDEKKKLAEGYVRYRGRWMSKTAYQAELARESDSARARTADLAAHATFIDGWEKETQHFKIKTNTSPELLEYYCVLLETYYDLMDKRVGIKPSPSLRRTKMQVNVYKTYNEFLSQTGKPYGVLGFFDFRNEELQFYHDYQEPTRSNWVALHEGTHLLTYLIEPQAWPQIWINEGVADFFGSARIERDRKGKLVIDPGELQVDRVLTVQQAIEDEKYIPLDELFFKPRQEYQGFEYAHGWSFVYFLNNSGYEKGFKKFFKDFYTIAKGIAYSTENFPNQQGTAKIVPPEEVKRVLLDRLGVKDLSKLEREWLDFIKAIHIDAPQARFKRGWRSINGGEDGLKRGLEDVQAAIDGGVDDPRAFWARGFLTLAVEGDRKKSLEDLRKAVELSPLDAGFRTNLAQVLAGLSLTTPTVSVSVGEDEDKLSGTADELAEADMHYGLACELEPDNEFLRESRDSFRSLYTPPGSTK
jgi:hypothetical protein